MSRWTHIAGLIRVDYVGWVVGRDLAESDLEGRVSRGAPIGSEGGLMVAATRTQRREKWGAEACYGYVSVVGDLRDFSGDDLPKVEAWLSSMAAELNDHERGIMVRQAVVQVEVEDSVTKAFSYDSDAEKFVCLGEVIHVG